MTSIDIPATIETILDTNNKPAICLYRPYPPEHPVTTHSKFGGWPNLPDKIDWPRDAAGANAPLHFIAQIHCPELPDDQTELPKTGTLFFFALLDEEADWQDGSAPQSKTRVIYTEDQTPVTTTRQPPDDTLMLHNDLVPTTDTFAAYEQDRLVTDIAMMQTVPEWPIKCASFSSFAEPALVKHSIPAAIDRDTSNAIITQYTQARLARLVTSLADATGCQPPQASTAPKPTHAEQVAERTREAQPWRHMSSDVASVLPQLAGFITEVAAHVGYAIKQEISDYTRRKDDNAKPAVASLNERYAQVTDWLAQTSAFSPAHRVSAKTADVFLQFLDDVAADSYSYETSRFGPARTVSRPTITLTRPFRSSIIQLARMAATDAAFCAALPQTFFDAPRHIVHDFNPLRSTDLTTPHQMLGFACGIDQPIPTEGVSVLLHLNSDPAQRFLFADMGQAIFLISNKDLKKRNFRAAEAHMQGG